jgi:hypothetical protein
MIMVPGYRLPAVRPNRQRRQLRHDLIDLLLSRCHATEELSALVGEKLSLVRDQLVWLRHLRVIEPIAIKSEGYTLGCIGYFRNLVWDLTDHGRNHGDAVEIPGCTGCQIRRLEMEGVTPQFYGQPKTVCRRWR